MRFSIYLGGTPEQARVDFARQDLALHLQASLESCGHRAVLNRRLVPRECNILLDDFEPELADAALDLAAGGTPVVAWCAAELVDAAGESDRDAWEQRRENFLDLAGSVQAVWAPSEALAARCKALVPEARVAFVPHGYTEGYPLVPRRPPAQQDIDFYFPGVLDAQQLVLAEALSQGYNVAWHDYPRLPPYVQRDYLSRAKVAVVLRGSPHAREPSAWVQQKLLLNRCFLLSERCPDPGHLDGYVACVAPAGLQDACLEALALADREARAEASLEALRRGLPMKEHIARALEASLAAA